MDGRYLPFANGLKADGCNVVELTTAITLESQSDLDVLVIANPLPGEVTREISSAFTNQEIEQLKDFVLGGGSLLLIADLKPYGEATAKLGAVFGIEMSGGFVVDRDEPGPIVFARSDGQLASQEITNGRTDAERINEVATFTGQAIRVRKEYTPLLTLNDGATRFADRLRPGQRPESSDVSGWHQGAVVELGTLAVRLGVPVIKASIGTCTRARSIRQHCEQYGR